MKDAPVEISFDAEHLEFTPADNARYVFLKLWAPISKEHLWIAYENVEYFEAPSVRRNLQNFNAISQTVLNQQCLFSRSELTKRRCQGLFPACQIRLECRNRDDLNMTI
jgi:hypothetical protein